ncbi:hypothetical protein NQ317_008375 [Molorchus minor]|uniref:Uncharacterized protein n=1 Tax=Molorchus minor TaxID=1323400 RepID=A0ABQ9K666_9CUCU|nr:hypothetical protein NQ317_008375 [Molorchus minor]
MIVDTEIHVVPYSNFNLLFFTCSYDLRKYGDVGIITDNLKCTEHVESNMDGSWTKKLRELCILYTTNFDLEHISNNYANKSDELIRNLCQGSGIYRDCQNVEKHYPIENLQFFLECSNCDC